MPVTRRTWGIIALVLAALGVSSWKVVLADRLETMREINAFIQRENRKLEREADEVKDIKDRVAAVMVRRTIQEMVVADTSLVPEAIAELSRLPREVVLHRIVVKGRNLAAYGEAASEADLARVLPALADARHAGKFALQPLEGEAGSTARRFRLDAQVATPPSSFGRGAGS